MLTIAVRGLDRLDELVPAVRQMGARHTTYGVTDAHYDTVAEALLWTLDRGLGADFTPHVRDSWVAVYTVLATAMQAGAAQTATA
jgi:nitric oxide dioxygenase